MKQVELTEPLCLIWAVTLLYGEMFTYWRPYLSSCSWPHLNHVFSSTADPDYIIVAIITDPQLKTVAASCCCLSSSSDPHRRRHWKLHH
ncbi:hypothetical protein FF2_038296 [Malus domestica]